MVATRRISDQRVPHLCQSHLGDDGQHDLLTLGWVRVLLVLIQPGLQCGGGLPRGVLPPSRQVVSAPVPAQSGSQLCTYGKVVRENV